MDGNQPPCEPTVESDDAFWSEWVMVDGSTYAAVTVCRMVESPPHTNTAAATPPAPNPSTAETVNATAAMAREKAMSGLAYARHLAEEATRKAKQAAAQEGLFVSSSQPQTANTKTTSDAASPPTSDEPRTPNCTPCVAPPRSGYTDNDDNDVSKKPREGSDDDDEDEDEDHNNNNDMTPEEAAALLGEYAEHTVATAEQHDAAVVREANVAMSEKVKEEATAMVEAWAAGIPAPLNATFVSSYEVAVGLVQFPPAFINQYLGRCVAAAKEALELYGSLVANAAAAEAIVPTAPVGPATPTEMAVWYEARSFAPKESFDVTAIYGTTDEAVIKATAMTINEATTVIMSIAMQKEQAKWMAAFAAGRMDVDMTKRSWDDDVFSNEVLAAAAAKIRETYANEAAAATAEHHLGALSHFAVETLCRALVDGQRIQAYSEFVLGKAIISFRNSVFAEGGFGTEEGVDNNRCLEAFETQMKKVTVAQWAADRAANGAIAAAKKP